jgi:hypothetical protein
VHHLYQQKCQYCQYFHFFLVLVGPQHQCHRTHVFIDNNYRKTSNEAAKLNKRPWGGAILPDTAIRSVKQFAHKKGGPQQQQTGALPLRM